MHQRPPRDIETLVAEIVERSPVVHCDTDVDERNLRISVYRIDLLVRNFGANVWNYLVVTGQDCVPAAYTIRRTIVYIGDVDMPIAIHMANIDGGTTQPNSRVIRFLVAQTYSMELQPLGIDSVIIEPGAYPTELFSKMIAPKDKEVLSEYGEMAKAPEQMFESMEEMFKGPNAPKPQYIAD